jgi:NAD(P)-dependent dehydrogenase (short-subunit alcohol dehydrogenase family)
MDKLKDKAAIVTGGASGIGYAIARGFAHEGARVCIADISHDRCAAAAREIGLGTFGATLDVRERGSIDALVSAVCSQTGAIDILINCAGAFGMQPLSEITEEEFDRIFSVSVRGLLFMTQAAARPMISQGRGGSIVNIASGAGRRAAPGAAVYSASKASVISITQAAALELIQYGIRVNAIAPGGVYTPMWTQVEEQFALTLGVEPGAAEKSHIAATPAGRMSTPEEYAGAAIFLASADSSYVVGQTLNVDGGMYLN